MRKFLRKRSITFVCILFLCCNYSSILAQIVPQAEPVYGGMIEEIDNYALSSTSTRVYLSTASPNSMFYSDVTNVNTSTPSFSGWNTIPDLDANDNYGFITCFAVDENSGFLYAGTQEGIFVGASTAASSIFTIQNRPIEAVEAYNSCLFWEIKKGPEEWMYIADLNASGNLITLDSSLIDTSPGWTNQFRLEIHINPFNNYVYLFVPGDPPFIYRSSDPYTSLSNSTTWTKLTLASLSATGKEYVSMGIAADGRIFCGSYEGNSSGFSAQVSYTDTDSDPWTTVTVIDDCGRGKISINNNTSGNYLVFFSRVYSTDQGSSWNPHGGADGAICVDPINEDYAYVRTDWGSGFFDNTTSTVTETNYGLLAVQVNDWAMNFLKDTAWVASKSGIWHVSGYGGASPNWSYPIWPLGHSVIWTEVESELLADPMYCGNSNGDVFKWTSSYGAFTNPLSYNLVFEAHIDSPYPYYTWTYGTDVTAIAIDPFSTNERIFVGLHDHEDWNEPEALGAVFVGEYTGGTWVFSQIVGSPMLYDGCDVNDMVVVYENSNAVIYVGVERNTTFGTVNGIYRIEETSPSIWSISNDLFIGPGYPISASIADICVTYNDTIFACGTDASGASVVSFKKAIGDTYWTALPQSGLPNPGTGRAITYDGNTWDVYMAVDNIVYHLPGGTSAWNMYWPYPLGSQIYCIYYDDLLVGTSTGLYSHLNFVSVEENNTTNKVLDIYPNPFSEETVFKFNLFEKQQIVLKIYDVNGKEIRTVLSDVLDRNSYEIRWNGKNDNGNEIEKGVYIYKMIIGKETISGKIVKN